MSAIRKFAAVAAGATAVLTFGAVATAAVTFNPESGTGFVGKGDVQLVYGWNNAELQSKAGSISFRYSAVEVSEVSWTCTNTNNDKEQLRERTTTRSVQGVVSSIARERNQVTGFVLKGYAGSPSSSVSSDGPSVNSCPSGPWTLTSPAGDPTVVSTTGGLQVSSGSGWTTIG